MCTEWIWVERLWNTCLHFSAFWPFCWDTDRSSGNLSSMPFFPWNFIRYSADDSLYLLGMQYACQNKEEKNTQIFIVQILHQAPARMKLAFLYHFLMILIPSLKYTWKGPFSFLFVCFLSSAGPSSLYGVGIHSGIIWGICSHYYMLRPAGYLGGRCYLRCVRWPKGFIQKSLVFL